MVGEAAKAALAEFRRAAKAAAREGESGEAAAREGESGEAAAGGGGGAAGGGRGGGGRREESGRASCSPCPSSAPLSGSTSAPPRNRARSPGSCGSACAEEGRGGQ